MCKNKKKRKWLTSACHISGIIFWYYIFQRQADTQIQTLQISDTVQIKFPVASYYL